MPIPASHVFFFSYAHDNKDTQLEQFFEHLCGEVGPLTPWGNPQHPKVSFRDGKNLPVMENWRPALMRGLQSSAVLVCVTTPLYITKPFCGQEYYIFDQRRRQGLAPGKQPPPVILPIIWTPVPGGLPEWMGDVQLKNSRIPDIYYTKGLRYLKKLEPEEYERCVAEFAQAIHAAWQAHPNIAEAPDVDEGTVFDDIPNAFAEVAWEEAADGVRGFRHGPDVANFVYAAGVGNELPQPPGRYGARSSEWRPYLPPEKDTIADLAREVVHKKSLRYREIAINEYLADELRWTRERKNLTIVVADPKTLPIESYQPVTLFDQNPWEGTAVLMPCAPGEWEDPQLQNVVAQTFPIRLQVKTPPFLAPIPTKQAFEETLDVTLTDLHAAVTRVAAARKEKTDEPPTQLVGPS